MKSSLQKKLQTLIERHQEISALLSTKEVMDSSDRFRDLSKEYAQLTPLAETFSLYQNTQAAIAANETLMRDSDPDMRAMAEEEHQEHKKTLEACEAKLQTLLLPSDPNDTLDVFLEIRAAAGGDEAAIFAGDLFRMYERYAINQRWQVEVLQVSHGEHGGFKSLVSRISGQEVYSHLKFESGAHRVQRVPETEAQGRVHTSTCTVAILPEVPEILAISINPADLRVDTFRASGAGGQHVNKTDSAIRITHIPTGTVVECQDERSQHKNRARAMSLLQSRLLAAEQARQQAEQASTRRNLVGTGDRSERIRTYNYPQGRLTDHRIGLTLYKLSDVLEGNLDAVIEPLLREHQADLLAAMGE